jgi:hypothetical protein
MNADASIDDEVGIGQPNHVLMEARAAIEQLTELFQSDGWVRSENPYHVQRAVDILQAFPALARRPFHRKGCLDGRLTQRLFFLPIHHVLVAKATSLQTVQAVLDMFPEAALCPEENSGGEPLLLFYVGREPLLPLHVACAYENGCSKEIITFLLEKGGKASAEMRFGELRPIDCFVLRQVLVRTSGDQVQKLLTIFDLLWDTLSRTQKICERRSLLRRGIRHGCTSFILHLLQKKPDFLTPKSFKMSLQEGDFQRATAMALLLPYLNVLECSWCTPFSPEGFRHMMHSLGVNTSISKLKLTFSHVMEEGDMKALEYFIGTNQSFRIYRFQLNTTGPMRGVDNLSTASSVVCAKTTP